MSSGLVAATARKSTFMSVFRVSSGNFLEMYDFMVYGYYATAHSQSVLSDGQ